jgi:hypothetical protein
VVAEVPTLNVSDAECVIAGVAWPWGVFDR